MGGGGQRPTTIFYEEKPCIPAWNAWNTSFLVSFFSWVLELKFISSRQTGGTSGCLLWSGNLQTGRHLEHFPPPLHLGMAAETKQQAGWPLLWLWRLSWPPQRWSWPGQDVEQGFEWECRKLTRWVASFLTSLSSPQSFPWPLLPLLWSSLCKLPQHCVFTTHLAFCWALRYLLW